MNEQRIEEQPYEDRHNTPPVPPAVTDFWLREQTQYLEDGSTRLSRVEYDASGERTGAEQSLTIGVPEPIRPMFERPLVAPYFGTGLTWQASAQSPVVNDLASLDWNTLPGMPNIELRTIYAHLIEAATLARAEMRERGMQVDL